LYAGDIRVNRQSVFKILFTFAVSGQV